MKSQDKAEQLIEKFLKLNEKHFNQIHEALDLIAAKQGALIVVDEILNGIEWDEFEMSDNEVMYWEEVKQHLIAK